MPEYRIEFWNKLNELVDLTVAIIEPELESRIYGLEVGKTKFKIVNVSENNIEGLIVKNSVVVLPPIDNLKCIKATLSIKKYCKKHGISFCFWTEKWEAPVERTPLKKKLRNIIQRQIFKICASGAFKYIAAGTKAKEYLIKIGIKERDIDIAIDSSTSPAGNRIDIREKYNIRKEKKIILYIGRLIKRKGCDVLIKACKSKLQEWNAVLLICGDGKFEDVCQKIAEGSRSIIFAGKIQPKERRSYYEQSDIFVLPSVITDGIVEGWGLTVNEALECGTPVIVTTAVGAGYDVVNEQVGKIVKENDPQEIQRATEALLKHKIIREQILRNSDKYSLDNMAASFANILNG